MKAKFERFKAAMKRFGDFLRKVIAAMLGLAAIGALGAGLYTSHWLIGLVGALILGVVGWRLWVSKDWGPFWNIASPILVVGAMGLAAWAITLMILPVGAPVTKFLGHDVIKEGVIETANIRPPGCDTDCREHANRLEGKGKYAPKRAQPGADYNPWGAPSPHK